MSPPTPGREIECLSFACEEETADTVIAVRSPFDLELVLICVISARRDPLGKVFRPFDQAPNRTAQLEHKVFETLAHWRPPTLQLATKSVPGHPSESQGVLAVCTNIGPASGGGLRNSLGQELGELILKNVDSTNRSARSRRCR